MNKEEQHIFILTQGIAAVLMHHNIATIPVDVRYINSNAVIGIQEDFKKIKNLLASLQILIYNYEVKYKKTHPYNKILTDFYFNFWRLKQNV